MNKHELVDLKVLLMKAFKNAVKTGNFVAQREYRSAFDQAAVDLINLRRSDKKKVDKEKAKG